MTTVIVDSPRKPVADGAACCLVGNDQYNDVHAPSGLRKYAKVLFELLNLFLKKEIDI
jgi:hypothetical protein